MFLRTTRLAVFVTCGLMTSGSMQPQTTSEQLSRIRQVVNNYVDNKTFMGTVLVAEKGRTLLSEGYGYADLDWNVPNASETRFRIGSLTKQFTAASILLLKERGGLKLESPIKDYFPESPAAWEKITVYDLLTHTSGIPNFTGVTGWNAYKRIDRTPTENIALVKDKPLDFTPGSRFFYSNTNYVILGKIIEKVSGVSYPEFLSKNILIPTQMLDTGVDRYQDIIAQRAQGYTASPEGFRHADYISMENGYSAGYLYSTVGDLLKWERALFSGQIINKESLKIMTTPRLGGYGTGVFVGDAAHHKVITHNGTIDGFDASLNYYPEKDVTVIVLGNVRTNAPDKIAEQIGKVVYGQSFVLNTDRVEVKVKPEVLRTYVGHYSAPPFALTVSVDGDTLIGTNPSGRNYVLHPESDKRFFLKEIDVQIEFETDPSTGKIDGFITTQDGVAKRVKKDG